MLKGIFRKMYRIDFLKSVPFTAVFFVFVAIMVLAVFTANKLRYDYWSRYMIQSYPDLISKVDEKGNAIQIGALDAHIVEFNSRLQGQYMVIFGLLMGIFFDFVWSSVNPRKPQVMS